MDLVTRLNTALEGRYRIERELGEGGMATVYLAEDLRHERNVALKVLKPELAAVVGAERFLAEIKTTANLQHPNILPLFDSGEAASFLFYVMPYVEGESLRDRLDREKQLPVDEAIRIATEVGEALQAAHQQGVIHRDIKPANILLSAGRPLVADFGIALAVSAAGGGRLTETGLSMGTPYYMSPEQASADRDPSPASDVYSLGCVLYEMLVGDPPFTASSAQAVLAKILTADAPVARQSRASIPLNVDAAIRKSIEKLPADRFHDANDFTRALSDPGFRYRADGGMVGPEATTGSGSPNRLITAMGAVIALLAVGLIWAGAELRERGPPTATASVARFDITSSLRDLFPVGGVALTLSADGQKLVYAAQGADGDRQLWLRSLEMLESEPILGTTGATAPALSPDGGVVAFQVEGSIQTLTLPDGPPFTVAAGSDPAWGDDGALYFEQGQIIHRVPPGGGSPEPFTESSGFDQIVPHPLPDGRGLLVSIRRTVSTATRIGVVGPDGGAVREILDGTQARYARPGHILYTTADGTLLVAPFDLEALEAGVPTPLLSGVRVEGSSHTQFAVSASGTLVYQTQATIPGRELIWVDRAGGIEVIDSSWVGGFSFPALSPDGSAVAVNFDGDAWVKRFEAGAPTQLSFEDESPVHPAWTPDGDSVLVNPGGRLLTYPADGTGQPLETLTDERGVVAPSWSPAGEWLVYRTNFNMEGGGDIKGARPGQDSTAVSFFATEASEMGPAISPDGRWLAYASGSSLEGVEAYVVPFPNVEDGRWLVGAGANPIWSRDGRELYYVRGDELVAVRVRTDPTFQILSSSVLFTRDVAPVGIGLDAPYDVAPDGRFLMVRRVGEVGPSKVILIQNLFAELERLVPN